MLAGVYSISLHCFSFSLPSCIHTQVWLRSPCCRWWCEHAPTVGATEGSLVRTDQPPLGGPWGNPRESLHWEEWCKPQKQLVLKSQSVTSTAFAIVSFWNMHTWPSRNHTIAQKWKSHD